MGNERSEPAWTYRDEALIFTLRAVAAVSSGRPDQLAVVPTNFAIEHADERVIVTGPYAQDWYGAIGDGSYQRSSFIAFGSGRLGASVLAASVLGSAMSNRRAERNARAAAADAWRHVDDGHVHVSTHGFYLDGAAGHRRFNWWAIHESDIAPGAVAFGGVAGDGSTQRWLIRSEYAELLFALWCLARHPMHPAFQDGSWYPHQVMRERARYFGRDLPALG